MSDFLAEKVLGAFKRANDWQDDDYNLVIKTESSYTPEDFYDWWHNGQEGDVLTLDGVGDFVCVEHTTGLNTGSTDDYNGGYTVWDNWVVFEHRGRYFKLDGSYDSWDGKGWHETVEEVEKVKKTIYVWEKKLDY